MPDLGSVTLRDVLDCAIGEADREVAGKDDEGDEQLARQRESTTALLNVVAQLAKGLEHAHSKGILHLDIKPSNVLMTSDGTPMLLDFNLAFDPSKTGNRLGGTIPYMSPEHLRVFCDPDETCSQIDKRSDIFSLGVLLHEIVVGKLPFEVSEGRSSADQAADLLKIQERGLRNDLLNSECSNPVLVELIKDCLAFDPEDRPASAGEVAGRLAPTIVSSEGTSPSAVRVLVVGIAATVLAVGGFFGFANGRQGKTQLIRRAHAHMQNGELTTCYSYRIRCR